MSSTVIKSEHVLKHVLKEKVEVEVEVENLGSY